MKNFSCITTLYVSEKIGHDDNSGVYYKVEDYGNGPFKTLGRALRFACGMRVAGYMQPVTIKLMDDEYDLTSPIEIGEFHEYAYNGGAKAMDITIEPFEKNKKV